jgi:hypothetical protein
MNPPKPILTRTTTCRIAYVSDRTEDRGRARGFEDFSITRFSDGSQTLRAHCTITDPPHVVREVVQTNDAHMVPLDCFVRVRTADAFTGSAWFRWTPEYAESENITASDGRQHQRLDLLPGPAVFCNHAIVGDAWMAAGYGIAQGPGAGIVRNMYSASPHTQGATGPALHRLTLGVICLGPEQISVAGGTFDTMHFRLGTIESEADLTPDKLTYETWVLTDGSYIPALSMYRGFRRYELTAYRVDSIISTTQNS